MRISTAQLYDNNVRHIMNNQRDVAETQTQLATGKRIVKPSDDAAGATSIVRMNEEVDKLLQYQRNYDLVTGRLEQQQTVLRNVTDSIQRARTLTIQAGAGSITQADRNAIASELEQIRNEVLDLMNTRNTDGDFVFSGFQSQTQPFVYNPAGGAGNTVTYNGDSGTNEVHLSDSVTVRSSSNGYDVFENVLGRFDFTVTSTTGLTLSSDQVKGQADYDRFHDANYDPVTPANNEFSIQITGANTLQVTNVASGAVIDTLAYQNDEPFVFEGMEFTINGTVGDSVNFSLNDPEKKNVAQTLDDLILALRDDTLSNSNYNRGISDGIIGLDNAAHNIELEVSSIGGRINVADSINQTNLDMELSVREARSTIEDVDYAEASAEFSRRETALSAALATFPQITNLSLFNYI